MGCFFFKNTAYEGEIWMFDGVFFFAFYRWHFTHVRTSLVFVWIYELRRLKKLLKTLNCQWRFYLYQLQVRKLLPYIVKDLSFKYWMQHHVRWTDKINCWPSCWYYRHIQNTCTSLIVHFTHAYVQADQAYRRNS